MTRRSGRARAWGVAVAAVVLAAFGVAAFTRRVTVASPAAGVEWAQTSAGVVAIAVHPAGAASAAGLLPGDLLEQVNGRPVASALEASSIGWEAGPGGSARLVVRRGRARLDLELVLHLRGTPPPLYGYLAVVGLAFLVSGTLIAMRWPTARGGSLYALTCGALFAQLVLSHTGRADGLDWAVYWGDVLAGALAPAFFLHLIASLSRRALPSGVIARVLLYAPGAALIVFAVWLVGLRGVHLTSEPVLWVELLDRLQLLYLGGAAGAAVWMLAKAHSRTSSALHRSQIRWLLWGLLIGLLPFLLLYALPWSLGASVPTWADLSVLPLLILPAAFTAAFARYRLHDLDLLLRRGLTEVTAVLFTLGVYAAVVEIVKRLGGGWLPLSRSGTRYFAILLAAVAYPKFRQWVRVAVDRAFYRSRYSYRATLLDWARDLNAEHDLPRLLERLSDRVRETLLIPEARVFLRGAGEGFEDPGSAGGAISLKLQQDQIASLEREGHLVLEPAAFPALRWARHLFGMKVKGRLRAILAAAERADEHEPLSSEDRALLATLSAHAATAIEAARLVHEVRRHAEEVERLKASQEQILESSGVGLILLDGDGRIRAWNRALEGIYGLTRAEAIGREIGEVFPLHLIRAIQREIGKITEGEETRIYRYNLVSRSGRRIVVNLTLSPVRRGQVADGSRVLTFDDVTEQVKLEEQVLRQERLASLGLLAAGVAHEVNTPLTGISSYAQLLLEEMPASDPRRALLEKIETQSRRASSIANSLLNFARPERGAFEPLSLNDTVAETLHLFEPQAREQGIRLDIALGAGLPEVKGHRGKLQQVLLNLLLNARDAVGAAGSIRIATYSRGERAVLEVTDDGVGIAEEDLSRIFDPFFTTKGRGKGTGLGLSISFGIVREHQGEMTVDSTPGECTRFRVELPAAQPAKALASISR